MNALYNNRSAKNCILFVHGLPCCSDCAKAIIQSGIKEIVTDSKASSKWGDSCKVAVEMFGRETIVELDYSQIQKVTD